MRACPGHYSHYSMPINNHSIVPLASLSASNLILPLIACTHTRARARAQQCHGINIGFGICTLRVRTPRFFPPIIVVETFCDRVARLTPWTLRGEEGTKDAEAFAWRERIVDSNSLSRNLAGIRFLIGEQSAENSHFVPSRRVSLSAADSTSCLFRRQTIVPSFAYRASLDSTRREE